VGGGVCQVSTTALQAAFYAGYPIDERWPHGYRVGYYETGEGVGMDATVFAPIVDFRFTNDTPYHLLIETYTNREAATVTWKFYSTSDRRTVSKDGPYISNIVRHKGPLYEVNPDLRPGTRKQVDYAADGADVTVYRTVYREGLVLYQDTFTSHYLPWRAVYQVPPGEVPPGAELASDQ
jgi:vancomycin resistance protein YoaR